MITKYLFLSVIYMVFLSIPYEIKAKPAKMVFFKSAAQKNIAIIQNKSGKKPNRLEIYNLKGKKIKSINLSFEPLTICSTDKYFVISRAKGGLSLFKINTLKEIRQKITYPILTLYCRENKVVTGGKSISLNIYSLPKFKKIEKVGEHASWITSIAFNQKKKYYLSTSWDHYAILWNGTRRGKVFKHGQAVKSAIFIPETSIIATIAADDRIRLWDTSNKNKKWGVLKQWKRTKNGYSLYYSSAFKSVIVTLKDGRILKYKYARGRLQRPSKKRIFKDEAVWDMLEAGGNKWIFLGSKGKVKFINPLK
ncbi:MAG: WD40 repeat domain-containing protein [Deltaproteobacteria bacterium]|jgi:WD40 repeat protein|nr:WD40 repeat domain-containing protein [Deltaproteobacteria bacterium]